MDLMTLPIPDWGLTCPRCAHLLAGTPEHYCPKCRQKLDMVSLVGKQRPIPEVGLECPTCRYSLTGLMDERCPECGSTFNSAELVEMKFSPVYDVVKGSDLHNTQLRLRDPHFTGDERPLPDFGLACGACQEPLAGAQGDTCPACAAPFAIHEAFPDRDWINLKMMYGSFSQRVRGTATNILLIEQVPFLVDNAGLSRAYGVSDLGLGLGGLRVPRDFVFDALHALRQAEVGFARSSRVEWRCPECGEMVPDTFEMCWSCDSLPPESPDAPDGNERSVSS